MAISKDGSLLNAVGTRFVTVTLSRVAGVMNSVALSGSAPVPSGCTAGGALANETIRQASSAGLSYAGSAGG